MKKTTGFWFFTACTLVGILIGFLVSPVKHGVFIGNTTHSDKEKSTSPCEPQNQQET